VKTFSVELPLPPPDNALSRTGGLVRYPTARYKDWLAVCEGLLRDALPRDHMPDVDHWWHITLDYFMPARGDMPNREKAVLDLLAGSTVRGGRVEKSGLGLFDDDARVKSVYKTWNEIGTPVALASVCVRAERDDAPPSRYVKPRKTSTGRAK